MKNLKEYGLNTDNNVYIIAEIGLNHGGDIELAKRLIDSAAHTGADAVKFQTYITEKRVPKHSPIFDILKKCELKFDAFKELKDYSSKHNIGFFSTPFDDESVDYLESINIELYKIASFDVTNLKFLERIASTLKPIILSVGMSNLDEIRQAYGILKKETSRITLLHCISAYPTKEEDANLAAIQTLGKNFDCVIGQSDHTSDIRVPLFAVAAGAQVIEKHYKISEGMECVDSPVSITEKQLTQMVREVRGLEKVLGDGEVGITQAQQLCTAFRRCNNI